jgi:uncharacterized protein
VLEQLGIGLETEASRLVFQQDFLKLERIVDDFNQIGDLFPARKDEKQLFLPPLPHFLPTLPIEDPLLHAQQMQLSHILETAKDYEQAKMLLQNSNLAHSAWKTEDWASEMLETAVAIAQKWKS